MNLSLSDMVKHEVSNTYQQQLKSNGGRVIIKVPQFYRENGLKIPSAQELNIRACANGPCDNVSIE
mgnify:CR=1 FL=1